jgi:hypothetical protein
MRAASAFFATLAILLSNAPVAQSASPPDSSSTDMSSMPGMAMPKDQPAKASKKPVPKKPSPPKPAAKSDTSMPGMNMPTDRGAVEHPAPAEVTPGPNAPMPGMDMQNMPGMDHAQAPASQPMPDMNMRTDHAAVGQDMSGMGGMMGLLGSYPMTREASGTSWQPDLAEHNGIHASAGAWELMGHAMLWGVYDTQSGPRGGDKLFAPGMVMGMARRNFGDADTLGFRAMLSPDPLMGKSGYPLLLATGETANGSTHLVDRQHPHDLFMELSSTYSHKFSPDDSAFLYFGYPGEPALGPPAFMHRASGMDIPQAPITHHWLDSTHVTFGVLTGGFVHDNWKLEVSRFTGREPDQNRYDFDSAKFDSTAVRASYNPDEHWSLQASWGYLKSPEQLDPTTNENRYTASASTITKFSDESSIAATLGWGLKDLSDGKKLNGVFLEADYKPAMGWTAFSRAEWEQSSEIDAKGVVRPVGEFTLGGIRDWVVAEHTKFGLGASYTFDFVGGVTPSYGSDPHGAMIFARLSLE